MGAQNQDPAAMQAALDSINAQNQALQQQIASQKQLMDTMPKAPQFQSLLDPATGLLQSQYQASPWQDVSSDQTGYNALKDFATSTGPSAYATAQLNAQKLANQKLQNDTQQQSSTANSQAQSALASKYGLSPAAAERLATQQQRNNMLGMQNVGFQGAQANAAILAQDAGAKQNQLANVQSLSNQNAQLGLSNQQGKLGVQEFNLNNAFGQKTAGDQAAQLAYQQQMQAFSAQKQADAMRASGGGGKK